MPGGILAEEHDYHPLWSDNSYSPRLPQGIIWPEMDTPKGFNSPLTVRNSIDDAYNLNLARSSPFTKKHIVNEGPAQIVPGITKWEGTLGSGMLPWLPGQRETPDFLFQVPWEHPELADALTQIRQSLLGTPGPDDPRRMAPLMFDYPGEEDILNRLYLSRQAKLEEGLTPYAPNSPGSGVRKDGNWYVEDPNSMLIPMDDLLEISRRPPLTGKDDFSKRSSMWKEWEDMGRELPIIRTSSGPRTLKNYSDDIGNNKGVALRRAIMRKIKAANVEGVDQSAIKHGMQPSFDLLFWNN